MRGERRGVVRSKVEEAEEVERREGEKKLLNREMLYQQPPQPHRPLCRLFRLRLCPIVHIVTRL